MRNSIEFFLNTHLEWSLSRQDLVITIIIPKPNKDLYNTTKFFCLIVLLNTIDKLIKKAISNRL